MKILKRKKFHEKKKKEEMLETLDDDNRQISNIRQPDENQIKNSWQKVPQKKKKRK